MNLSYLLSITTLLPMASDTPPARRIEAPAPRELRAVDDVVLTARLADGSRVPSAIVLPQLQNRSEVFGYLHANYPDTVKFGQPGVMPVAWVYIDETGATHHPVLIVGSGNGVFDSLALEVVKRARFAPAVVEKKITPVWVMLPVQLSRGVASAPHPLDRPTPPTKKPRLLNRNAVAKALVRNYPPGLRNAGIGGRIDVWLHVNEQGAVDQARVHKSSGFPELDRAALQVARVMVYAPAEDAEGEEVAVWIQVPVVFKTN